MHINFNGRILKYFLIAFLALFLILLPFRILVFNHTYYDLELEKLGVSRDVNNSQIVLNETIQLLKYGEPPVEEYGQRENLHLLDVKRVLDLFFVLFGLSLLMVIVLSFTMIRADKKLFCISLFFGSLIALVLVVLLALFFIFGFQTSFEIFHKLFFQPGTYIFNPDTELLKAMFPDEFFSDFAVLSFGITAVLSCFVIRASAMMKKHWI